MSVVSGKRKSGSKSSNIHPASIRDLGIKSQNSRSFNSEHGSKFGRSVSKFLKHKDDLCLNQSVSTVNSRVFPSIINFPLKASSKLPDLKQLEATDCIRELGGCLKILDYEHNFLSFWILDILSKLIKHMQLKGLPVPAQKIHLSWFRFILRTISISGDLREELFSILQEMFLQVENYVKAGKPIPEPEVICSTKRKSTNSLLNVLSSTSLLSIYPGKNNGSLKTKFKSSSIKNVSVTSQSSRHSSTSEGKSYAEEEEKVAKNLQTLHSIIEMVYSIFADRFMFSLISQAYSSPTIVVPVDVPLAFKEPKLLTPTEAVTTLESSKSKKSSLKPDKRGKGKRKGNRKGSPSSTDNTAFDGENNKKSKMSKSKKKEIMKQLGGNEVPIESEKNVSELSNIQRNTSGSKTKIKKRDKSEKRKTKNKSKSSENIKTSKEDKINSKPIKSKHYENEESNTFEKINIKEKQQMKERLALFEGTVAPKIKSDTNKTEIDVIGILPLAEGVSNGYVENLIHSLLPLETKLKENAETSGFPIDKIVRKSKRSTSSMGKKKKHQISATEKRAKHKKK